MAAAEIAITLAHTTPAPSKFLGRFMAIPIAGSNVSVVCEDPDFPQGQMPTSFLVPVPGGYQVTHAPPGTTASLGRKRSAVDAELRASAQPLKVSSKDHDGFVFGSTALGQANAQACSIQQMPAEPTSVDTPESSSTTLSTVDLPLAPSVVASPIAVSGTPSAGWNAPPEVLPQPAAGS